MPQDLKQRSYLYRYRGANTIRIGQIKSAKHPEIRKQIDTLHIPGIGTAPVMKGTGKRDHSQVQVNVGGAWITLRLHPKDVRQCLRLLREDEAVKLRAIELKIRELEQAREELIKQAWTKGHVVLLKDLEEMAKEGE